MTTLKITLNGDTLELPGAATIAALVAERKPRPPFAIELNKSLVRRPDYATTPLSDGDVVEIVTLVGGG